MVSAFRMLLAVALMSGAADGGVNDDGAGAAAAQCPDGMVYVPVVLGGKYTDGTAAPDQPAFCIDKYETTVEEYRSCRMAGRCPVEAKSCRRWKHGEGRLPIECANLAQAVAYCGFRGKRLPTSSEWERAASGMDRHRWNPWSPKTKLWPDGVCWDRRKRQGPCPVGTSAQDVSPIGAYDMGANVQEWTYRPKDPARPLSEEPEQMIQTIAGASWSEKSAGYIRPGLGSTFSGNIWRSAEAPLRRAGIRCARNLEGR